MQAALAALLPFEVLDGVSHVNLIACQADCCQAFIEDAASGSDERFALQVLLVTRNFANEHQLGTGWAAAEDGLRGAPVQLAALATVGRFLKRAERQTRR
jgi:hypothetical protein